MTDPGETQRAGEGRRGASAAPDKAAEHGKRGGLVAAIRAHPTAWLASVLAVVFVLLGTGAVFAGVAAGTLPAPTPTPTPTVTPDPPRPTPSAVPEASRLRTCSVADLAKDPRLADFQG